MGTIQIANNCYGALNASCLSSDTTIYVNTGSASAAFPAVTTASGNYFYACLQDVSANLEIVKVTNISGTAWTVTRAQESTTAKAFAAGSAVELRVTAQTVMDLLALTVPNGIAKGNGTTFSAAVAGTDYLSPTKPAAIDLQVMNQQFGV